MADDIIRIRRDNLANWTTVNPVLSVGEISYDTTSEELRIGDGTTAWLSLPAVGAGGGGGGGGPSSTEAPKTASYIVRTADGTLTNETVLGSLATGILKNTTTTGVLTIATGTDLPSHNHTAAAITSGIINYARLGYGTPTSNMVLNGDQDWIMLGQDNLVVAEPVVPTDVTTKNYVDQAVGLGYETVLGIINEPGGIAGLDASGKLLSNAYVDLVDGMATTAYVREDSGPSIGTYIDDHLDVPNYIAKLDSDKRISASSLPVAGISMRNLKYSERDKANTGRNIIRTMHTDGTSVGDFVWSTYSAVDPLASATLVHTDTHSYIQTEENQSGSVGRVRHCHTGYSGINPDMKLDDCPKEFKAHVKYDGALNNSTVASVGFHGTHGTRSQLLACFDCLGTTNWWMRVVMGYTETPSDRGIVGSYENVVYFADTGIPVNQFTRLGIRIVLNENPRDLSTGSGVADGIYFYSEVPQAAGSEGSYKDYVETGLGSYLLTGPIVDVFGADPHAYVGLELRQRNEGTNKSSQKLYFKDMTYLEYNGYSQFAPIAHTHTLADLTQSAATDGQVVTWNNTALAWQPATPSGGGGGATTLDGLTDVTITAASTGDILFYSATAPAGWTNQTRTNYMNGFTLTYPALQCPPAQLGTSRLLWWNDDMGLTRTITPSGTGIASLTLDETANTMVVNVPASHAHALSDLSVSATDKLLGRSTAGAGVVEEIPCTAVGRAIIAAATSGDQRTHLGLLGLARLDTVTDTEIVDNTISGLKITDATLTVAKLNTTGTASASTYLNGMGAWSDVSDVHTVVKNMTGSTITKGSVVYISGANGQTPLITKAIATSDPASAQTLGLVSANIADNATGSVMIMGLMTGLDTSAFSDGAQLYLSPATAGALTATKPVAPDHLVYVAVVAHSNPSVGKLIVKVQNGYELNEIHDALIVSPAAGQVLTYDSGSSLWKNQAPIAPAGTLAGTTLAAGVTASSLTSVGTLATLTVTAPISGSVTGNAATVTTNANLTGHITSTGNAAVLGSFTSSQLRTALSDETGSGAAVFSDTPTLVTPILGTPTSGNLSNCTNLPSHVHAGTDITTGTVAAARLGTGTTDNTTYLRGDNTWTTVSAAPAGSTTQVQYNNAGAAAGATNIVVDSNNLRLLDTSITSATAAGGATLFSKKLGLFHMPSWNDEQGIWRNAQVCLGRSRIGQWNGNNNIATAPTAMGVPIPTAIGGTLTARNMAATSVLAATRKIGIVSAGTAAAITGWRTTNPFSVFSSTAKVGGGQVICRFAISDASLVTGARTFIGINYASSNYAAGTEVDTLFNQVGFAQLTLAANPGNLYILYNDGTGTATKIDTGYAINITDLLEATFQWIPGSSTLVGYRLDNLTSGSNIVDGVLTTDLPVNNTLLHFHMWRTNGSTGLAVGLDMAHVYFETYT